MNNKTQPSYKEEVTQYTKKDAIHALLFAAYITLMAFCSSILVAVFDVTDVDGQMTFVQYLWGIGFALIALAPLFVIMKKKGQKLRSLGLHLIGWKKALIAGLFFVVMFLMLFHGLLPGLLAGWRIHSPVMVVWIIVYVLILAVWEDIVYVGYIQTRIYGLIKRDFLAIGIVGLLFMAMHYPGFIISNIISGKGFGIDFWLMFVGMSLSWIMGHILFNTLFRKFRSIIVVTLFHFSSNIALRGDLWVNSDESNISMFFIVSGGIAFCAFLLITVFLPYLKKRRTAK
jgi:hypothetical protein